ncbi:MAG: hypothetical protein DMG00_05040 [Acidobacteria bacterium]|nr:MAG: hypothetical protein DMG00_05040 [Acidobacteriota bacterium]
MLSGDVNRVSACVRHPLGAMAVICAVIAAFNEERHVADVVAGTRAHVADVLVVDDGSSDETAARAHKAGARVVRHDRNRGKGSAVRTGLAHALHGPICSTIPLRSRSSSSARSTASAIWSSASASW